MLDLDKCSLCRLWYNREIETRLYYEDELLIIVDCVQCKIPMIVIKRHTMEISDEEEKRILSVKNKLWPNSELRCEQRSIRDHYHCHVIILGKNDSRLHPVSNLRSLLYSYMYFMPCVSGVNLGTLDVKFDKYNEKE